jgi:two-component system, chemotaxis family, response regulator Rcp1
MTDVMTQPETWRIFLVEDNQGDVWLIQEAFKRQALKFELDHHTTVEDAMHAARQSGTENFPVPDVMLLDYNLPGGHGGDILAVAAENPRLAKVPKVIMTSFLRPDEIQEARRLGAHSVITKPGNLNEFLTEVGSKVTELLKRSGEMGARRQTGGVGA